MQKKFQKYCSTKKSKNYTTTNALVTMYKALVLPHFTYCSTVWQQGNVTHFDKLHKLQKRAARVITNSSYEVRSAGKSGRPKCGRCVREKSLKRAKSLLHLYFSISKSGQKFSSMLEHPVFSKIPP